MYFEVVVSRMFITLVYNDLNLISGGGTESDSNYPQWRKVSRPMDKVSNLQLLESFTKLVDGNNNPFQSVIILLLKFF